MCAPVLALQLRWMSHGWMMAGNGVCPDSAVKVDESMAGNGACADTQ